MIIESINNCTELNPFVKEKCEDEGLCVNVDDSIQRLVIIKPDEYYNSLHLANPPASVDCIIVQECADHSFRINIIELKNVKSASHIDNANLISKFSTVLFDFIHTRFRNIFLIDECNITYRLYLCAAKTLGNNIKSYSLDFLLGLPPINFYGKILGINGWPPDISIEPC